MRGRFRPTSLSRAKSIGFSPRFPATSAVWMCSSPPPRVGTSKPLETTTADHLRAAWEVDVLATFLCCQRAGAVMVRQPEGGSIVTIGDWAVARPYPDYAAYLTAKGSIPAMTRVFAVELARRNPAVRVNCILPGPVMLPPDLPAKEREAAIAGTLVRREGRPEHVAHAVLFLIENDFVTGVCLPVDGGRSISGGEGGLAQGLG